MLFYLHLLDGFFGPLNVFQYGTFRTIMAALTAFFAVVFSGPWVIRQLLALKIGQPIRSAEEVHKLHELHGKKLGTPTMGGVMILGAVIGSTLLWARPDNHFVWLGLLTLLVLGGLGFADDFQKVVRKNSKGISARQKLGVQIGLALVIGMLLMVLDPNFERKEVIPANLWSHAAQAVAGVPHSARITDLYLPFLKNPVLDLQIVALAFFCLVMVGSSNAVNLTDGLDGLAIGCTIIVAGTLTAFAYIAGQSRLANELYLPHVVGTQELAIMTAAMTGAGMGFLWYNCHPAKVFMGDTGSLAIGGFLGYVAICIKQEIVLAIIGGVFVMEALSVILQVASFKSTGKRIFLMSPIHHHFELKGWNESTVVIRFWILSIIFALIGLSTLKLR
ncbi:MAG: phospho-N-acetylmuramoyl-pentapeptide-transferase [Verrucomicrobiae bacterium]|nr:phospho-N-acetylmuramoyl-pentapeptide-transferase [Verrucomicrobiae bacterium]